MPHGAAEAAVGMRLEGVAQRIGGRSFDLRRDGLYLTREDRGILPLSLPAGTRSVWDGRFIVENRSAALVEITKSGEGDGSSVTDDRLPRSALRRSLVTAPALKVVDDANVSGSWQEADVSMAVYFAPFDRFLTRFDFIFAQRLAAAFGTRPYPTPPLGLIDGKSI
jgi:tRNA(Ile)-lysidine synthase